MTDLVVARFNEDLDWLEDVADDFSITIYNKGPESDFTKFGKVINLPNDLGRDTQVYLYHIISNYDNLVETVFTNGNPFKHSSNFLVNIRKGFDSNDLKQIPDREPGWALVDCATKFHDDFIGYGNVYIKDDFKTYHRLSVIKETFSNLFSSEYPERFTFAIADMFRVSKKGLESRSKLFYEIAEKLTCIDPEARHSFERMWPMIFDPNSETTI